MKTLAAVCVCLVIFSACKHEKEEPIYTSSDKITAEEHQWFAELEKEAKQGSQEAQFKLVFHRDWMKGHYEKAWPVLRDLAQEDNMDAATIVALAYRQGLGVDKDYEEAARWLERAAALGSESAQRDLEHYAKNQQE